MTDKRPMKEWKDYSQQLDILQTRGLLIDDEKQALVYLKTLGYYRLSGYLYSFRKISHQGGRSDYFLENSRFSDVKQLYI